VIITRDNENTGLSKLFRGLQNPGPLALWYSPKRKRFWLSVLIISYLLSGFFLIPAITKQQLAAQLSQLLQKPVVVESVSFNPLSFTIDINHFGIEEANGDDLLGFQQLRVNFQLSSLFRRAWTFSEIQLTKPFGALRIRPDGTTNFHDLIPKTNGKKEEKTDANLPRVIIQRLAIVDGFIDVTDFSRRHTTKPAAADSGTEGIFNSHLGNINFSLSNLSTLPDQKGTLNFGAASQHDTSLSWNGTIQLNPVRLEGSIAAKGGYLPLAYRYFEDYLNFSLDQGNVDLALDYRLALVNGDIEANINNADLEITSVTIKDQASALELITLPKLALQGLNLKWPQKEISALNLVGNSPRLFVERLPNNSLNLQHLMAASPKEGPKALGQQSTDHFAEQVTEQKQATNKQSETGAQSDTGKRGETGLPETAEQSGWVLSLKNFAISDLELTFKDSALPKAPEVKIVDMDLSLKDLSNQPNSPIPLTGSMVLAGGGTASIEGDISPLPTILATAIIAIDRLPLTLAQPYIEEIAAVELKGGELSMSGAINHSEKNPFSIVGKLSTRNFSLHNSRLDTQLLAWENLTVSEFSYSLADSQLALNELNLVKPEISLVIHQDKTTNFTQLVKTPASGAAPSEAVENTLSPDNSQHVEGTSPKTSPFRLAIGRISLEDGTTAFSDHSLPIPFDTRIHKFTGSISPIDTTDNEPAILAFEGEVDDYGHAVIKGSVLAHDATSNADISASFRNLIMPDLSPYSIAFAGREISKGRMNLDLQYRLDQGKLAGDNSIVLTDLTLGKRVEYEGAMSLPLDLALALLKDVNGKIDLDLAVNGDTNDPKFSVAGIVGKALANLITKAVTAPFRLLGSLVGAGSDDVGTIEFEPGSSNLTPPEREKIASLAEALLQRPGINLRVAGAINPDADRRALKERKVDQAIAEIVDNAKSLDVDSRTQALETLFSQTFEDEPVGDIRQMHTDVPEGADENSEPKLNRTSYNKVLYSRLVAATELAATALEELADSRAKAAIKEFHETSQLAPARISQGAVKETKKVKSGRIPLKLDLVPASSK